jgi:DNA-binding transcriptional LysR family regulator
VRHEVRHWLSVVSLVSQGLGVALVPAALRHSALGGAVFVPLDAGVAHSQSYCIWKTANDNAALTAFLELTRTEAARQAKNGKSASPP